MTVNKSSTRTETHDEFAPLRDERWAHAASRVIAWEVSDRLRYALRWGAPLPAALLTAGAAGYLFGPIEEAKGIFRHDRPDECRDPLRCLCREETIVTVAALKASSGSEAYAIDACARFKAWLRCLS